MLKPDQIITTDILPYDLRLIAPVTDHMPTKFMLELNLTPASSLLVSLSCYNYRIVTAHHHGYASLCTWTHNICTLNMQSWSRLHSDNTQTMDIHTHSERHMIRIKIVWTAESSQTCVTWPPWGGRKGMSSNKPPIVPSPFSTIVIFKKSPFCWNRIRKFQNYKIIQSLLQCGSLETCLLSLIQPLQCNAMPLPLHCTIYPRLVSTTAPNTLTDPLLPHPPDVTNIPPSIHTNRLSCTWALHLSTYRYLHVLLAEPTLRHLECPSADAVPQGNLLCF